MARYKYRRKNGVLRREHDLIWEEANGPIPVGHEIHHINGKGKDNRLENLVMLTRKEHRALHAKLRREGNDVVDQNDPDVIADRKRCSDYVARHHAEIVERRKLHKAERDIYNHQYHQAHKDAINERHRKHNLEHPEIKRAWKEKNKERIAAQNREYQQAHREHIREYAAAYRKAHAEKCREYQRQYQLRKKMKSLK